MESSLLLASLPTWQRKLLFGIARYALVPSFRVCCDAARQFKLYHLVDLKKARHAPCLLMNEERFGGANHLKLPTNYPVFSQIADPFRRN